MIQIYQDFNLSEFTYRGGRPVALSLGTYALIRTALSIDGVVIFAKFSSDFANPGTETSKAR